MTREITHELSKITVRRQTLDNCGWEIDGYEEINGFNVKMYIDGYYTSTSFVSSDFHEIIEHLKKINETISYYTNKEDKGTILKIEHDHMEFIKNEKLYYESLLEDLEKL